MGGQERYFRKTAKCRATEELGKERLTRKGNKLILILIAKHFISRLRKAISPITLNEHLLVLILRRNLTSNIGGCICSAFVIGCALRGRAAIA